MPDVILIQPLNDKENRLTMFPLGLLAISSLLDKESYKIKIIDQNIDNDWKKHLIDELKKEPICAGITSTSSYPIIGGLAASKIIKENSNIPIIWGGIHPSLIPEQTLENDYVDIVVEGEGELTFYELVKALEKRDELSKIRGIWYKNEKVKRYTGQRALVDLNKLPDPPYHLIDINEYKITDWTTNEKVINAFSSRGCINNCSYCYNTIVYKNLWRALSVKRTVNLIKKLKNDYNVRGIMFVDDNFYVDKKRVKNIVKEILKEKLDLKINFPQITVKSCCEMGDEDLRMLNSIGCEYFAFGLETGSQRIRRIIKKDWFTNNQVLLMNRRLSKYSFSPTYNVMCGFPSETKKEFIETLQLCQMLKKENSKTIITGIYLYTPWPKTEGYKLALKYGFVPPNSLEEWSKIDYRTLFSNEDPCTRPWISKKLKEFYEKTMFINLINQNSLEWSIKRSKTLSKRKFLRTLLKLYKPIANFRYKHCFYDFMPTFKIANILYKIYS